MAYGRVNCPDYKAVVCHAGSVNNPNFQEICVSFSSLYGHLAEHEMDYYGECGLRNVKAAYACNAGLRHQDADKTICIQKDNDFEQYVDSCGSSKNCTCYASKDLYKFDYFNVQTASFDPYTQEVEDLIFSTRDIQAGQDRFKVATSEPAKTVIKSENGLSFRLGSERLNAQYFVDMCWTNTTGSQDYQLDFSLDSRISSNWQGVGPIDYPSISNLYTKFQLFCDINFDGVYDYDTATLVDSTEYVPFSVGQYSRFDFSVYNAEFCYVRQAFIENNMSMARPWDLKGITVLNNLISDEEVIQDGPIEICHVQEITNGNSNGTNGSYGSMIETVTVGTSFTTIEKKKIYECTNLRFNDSNHLKTYIKYGKDEKDFRDVHQHDYVGICNNICGPIHGNGAN